MSKVVFSTKEYVGKDLTGEEEALLERHVKGFIGGESNYLRSLLNFNWQSIIGALQVAKEQFKQPFRGILATDSEIGVQLIRPGHVMRTTDTTETPANDWTFSFTADEDYWVGFGTNNTTAANIDKELLLLLLGVQFTQGNQPTVEELYIQIGETVYAPYVIRQAWQADNPNRVRAQRIHPLLIEPKQTLLVQTYSILAGTNELVLLGLAFGPGRFLRKTSYTAVAL